MKINDIKIGVRLSVIISLVVILSLGGLGIFLVNKQTQLNLEEADLRISKQIEDFEMLVLQQIADNQAKVVSGLKFAEYYLAQQGRIVKSSAKQPMEAKNQISGETQKVNVNKWFLNGKLLQNSAFLVDNIKEYTDGTVTLFQRIDEGFLRISTNVITKEGKRAVGTFIPSTSPVIKTIEKGETFYGRAFVVDDWYLTAYKPLVINGNIEGILYVGVNEKDLSGLKQIFSDRKFCDTGYPYLVDSKGNLLIHPTAEGNNISDEEVFIKTKEAKTNHGSFFYTYKGVDKYQYFRYIDKIDSYIAGAVTQKELLAGAIQTRNTILTALLFTTALVIVFVYLISQNITTKLKEAVSAAKVIATSDLTQKIAIDQKDEIGELAGALNFMIDGLRTVVGKILAGSENISSASNQLNGASQQLSQGANEQAASIEEVSSTMEEIAANIKQSTDNANQTAAISSEANKGVEDVSERSKESVSANKVIAEKIQIINAIASKTDLLAINASIEAARAGEHGKGFAVVATEVRKLAENSQKAADEIVQLAASSFDISTRAGDVMFETIPKIEKAFHLVEEIAAAGNEQSGGVSQVNDAIQQLNNVTQINASASEELASNAEELSSQAMMLKELISSFKI